MTVKFPLETFDFQDMIENESSADLFLTKYEEYLSNSRQRIFMKLKDNQQRITENKVKCQELDFKIIKQEDLREQLKLKMQIHCKEYNYTVESKNKIKVQIENMRIKKSELTEKLVDINHEIQEKNDDMKNEWSAIVKACNVYKKYLDIHIKMETFENTAKVQVTFFINENPAKDNYYVVLLQDNNNWIVDRIVPELKPEDQHLIDNLPHEMQHIHVTILLCKLRKIFYKYKK